MGWADEFAEGFAAGFVPTYTARMERQAQEDQELLKAKIAATEESLAQRNEQRTEDLRMWNQASTISSSVGKGDAALAYRLLQTYEDPETVTEMLRENPVESLDQQTESAVAPEPTQTDTVTEDPNAFNTEQFRERMRMSESSGRPDAYRTNKDGRSYAGLVQMGPERLEDYNQSTGANLTPEQYRTLSEEDQRTIEDWHFQDLNDQITNSDLSEYVGRDIGGVKITREGIVAMAHLGGVQGARRFLESDGRVNPADELGTRLSDYASRFGGGPAPATERQTEAMLAEGGQPEGEDQGVPDNAFTTLMGWNDAARERAVDSRFQRYLGETGQLEAYEASQSGSVGLDVPASGYRLTMTGGNNEALNELVGKSPSEIDQWMIANGSSLSPEESERVGAMRDVAVASENDSEWWKNESSVASMSTDALQSAVALAQDENQRETLLTALEARQQGDVPTSAKDFAFTTFFRNLPGDMSADERMQAAADFENTWSDVTNPGGGFDIFQELTDANSTSKLSALRVSVANNPDLAENRDQYLDLIDQSMERMEEVTGGGYDMDDYISDLAKYTTDLSSEDEEVRRRANEWMASERPAIEASLRNARQTEIRIEASALEELGVPSDLARLQAAGLLSSTTNPVTGNPQTINTATSEVVAGESNYTGPAQPLLTEPPEDFDITQASEEAREISMRSSEELSREAEQLQQELLELSGSQSVEDFEETLRTIDIGAALGLPGVFSSTANTAAGAFGQDAPFPANRTASAALERLQRLSALTLAQAQTNQRGSVYLLDMLQKNDVSPNEFTGVDGAREKFEANFAIISDRVRDLERIAEGRAGANASAVSNAREMLPSLRRVRDYYGALVENARNTGAQPSGRNFITGEEPEQETGQQTDAGRPTQQQAMSEARAAIADGADREAVRQRLIQRGYDASGL